MSDLVSPILQWLNANPHWAGLATFIISAGESVAIIGTIVPGSIMMTAIGTLAGAGVIPLWETIIWAILGAIVGDGISYWFGRYFKERLPRVWPFRNYPNFLVNGEKFFHKYGSMSVFIGRFVGPVRAIVPLIAGMLGMRPLVFTIANITSAILWAPVYMLPGIMLGAASLELPPEIALHVIVVLLLITLFILLCLWFVYKLFQLGQKQLNHFLHRLWRASKSSSLLAPIATFIEHHDTKQMHQQLTLTFLFLLSTFLFLILAAYTKYVGPPHIMINEVMFHLFRGIRNATLDSIMIAFTILGQKAVLLPVVFVIFLYLLLTKRWRAAIHAIAIGVLGAGGVFVTKHVIQTARPWGILIPPTGFSMPSGHATLSTTVFLGIAFLLTRSKHIKRQWPIYGFCLIFPLLVGISRMYLGAHWFTDVLAGWLLSVSVLLFVIISYQRRPEPPLNTMLIVFISFVTLMITYSAFYYTHAAPYQHQYTLLDRPHVPISGQEWWEKNQLLETYQVSLFGFPSETINIEWSGHLSAIHDSLLKAGWSRPPSRNFISTLHRLANISSTEYLPLVSLQYLDKKPELTLTKRVNGQKNLIVLRLWNSHRYDAKTHTPLWVGTVGNVSGSYNWLFRKPVTIAHISPTLIFPTPQQTWEWKMLKTHFLHRKKTIHIQVLLLRKKQGNN